MWIHWEDMLLLQKHLSNRKLKIIEKNILGNATQPLSFEIRETMETVPILKDFGLMCEKVRGASA